MADYSGAYRSRPRSPRPAKPLSDDSEPEPEPESLPTIPSTLAPDEWPSPAPTPVSPQYLRDAVLGASSLAPHDIRRTCLNINLYPELQIAVLHLLSTRPSTPLLARMADALLTVYHVPHDEDPTDAERMLAIDAANRALEAIAAPYKETT